MTNRVYGPAGVGQKQVGQPQKYNPQPASNKPRQCQLENKHCRHDERDIKQSQERLILDVRTHGEPSRRIAAPNSSPIMMQNHDLLPETTRGESSTKQWVVAIDDPACVAPPKPVFGCVGILICIGPGMVKPVQSHLEQR